MHKKDQKPPSKLVLSSHSHWNKIMSVLLCLVHISLLLSMLSSPLNYVINLKYIMLLFQITFQD